MYSSAITIYRDILAFFEDIRHAAIFAFRVFTVGIVVAGTIHPTAIFNQIIIVSDIFDQADNFFLADCIIINSFSFTFSFQKFKPAFGYIYSSPARAGLM